MAYIPSLADQKNYAVTLFKSTAHASAASQKFVPKDEGGTIIDCTTMTAVSIHYAHPVFSNPLASDTDAPSFDFGDATGIVISLTDSVLTTLVDNIGTNPVPFTMTMTDGTDTWTCGQGNITVVVKP